MSTNKCITNVEFPNINDISYADGIMDSVNTINSNFNILANHEFIKGDAGKSAKFDVIEITPDTKDEICVKLKEYILGLLDGENYNDRYLANFTGQFVVIRDENNNPISSLEYVFMDGRFWRDNIGEQGSNYFEGISDKSCIIKLICTRDECDEYDEYGYDFTHYERGLATMYYDNGLCWKLNGKETGLPVQGVAGKDGINTKLEIVTAVCENSEYKITHIVEGDSKKPISNIPRNNYDKYLNSTALVIVPKTDKDPHNQIFFGVISISSNFTTNDPTDDYLIAIIDPEYPINNVMTNAEIVNAFKNVHLLNKITGNELPGLFVPITEGNDGKLPVHLLTSTYVGDTDSLSGNTTPDMTELLLTPISDINDFEIGEDNNKLYISKDESGNRTLEKSSELDYNKTCTLNIDYDVNVLPGHDIYVNNKSISERMIEITYDELKQLRDNSKLIPGQQYRITDYITTTSQDNTISAGHIFDIIVTADDVNVLNEKARAIQHKDDMYFTSSNLAAWEIWYCLDNDKDRFVWSTNYSNEEEYNIFTCKINNIFTARLNDYDLPNSNNGSNVVVYIDKETNKVITKDDLKRLLPITDNLQTQYYVSNKDVENTKNFTVYNKNDNFDYKVFDLLSINKTNSKYVFTIVDIKNDAPITYEFEIHANSDIKYNLLLGLKDIKSFLNSIGINDINSIKNITWYNIKINGIATSYFIPNVYIDNFELIEGTSNLFCIDIENLLISNECEYIKYKNHSSGVIYRMIDEFGNDCPYDFKNIQFARWELSNPDGSKAININNEWEYIPYDKYNSLKEGFYGSGNNSRDEYFEFGDGCNVSYTRSSQPTYCYTFGKDIDYSFVGNSSNNVIKEYSDALHSLYLNNIVFLDVNCNNNIFGKNCSAITIGSGYNNIFGKNCSAITIGSGHSNIFGNSCRYIIFGNNCSYNTFGNVSGGADKHVTIFHNHCSYNTLGDKCIYITLGLYCMYNTFMYGAYDITIGDSCAYNYFGGDCRQIIFGNNNEIKGNYSNIVFENHNVGIYLDCTASLSEYDEFSNVRIASAYNYNTSTSPAAVKIESSEKNQTYSTVHGRDKSGNRIVTYGI